jgi:hypothetical protein
METAMNIILFIIVPFFLSYYLTRLFLILRRQRNNLLAQLNQLYSKIINLSEAGMKKHNWKDSPVNVTTEIEAEDYVIIKYGLMPIASKIAWHCVRLNIIPFSFVPKGKSAEYIKQKYQKYLPIINDAYKRFIIN